MIGVGDWFNANPVLGVLIVIIYGLIGFGTATFLMSLLDDPRNHESPEIVGTIVMIIAVFVWPVVAALGLIIGVGVAGDKLGRKLR